MTHNQYHSVKNLNQILFQLNREASNNIETILDEFGVDYKKNNRRLFGTCPVHEGDNSSAFNCYTNNNIAVWMCHTHHCEEKYGKGIVGLVKGILSSQRGREVGVIESAKGIARALGYKSLDEVKIPTLEELKREKVNSTLHKWSIQKPNHKKSWTTQQLKGMVDIPAQYYMDRGYKSNTLKLYDVGYYNKLERVLVPVYDIEHKYVLGCVGRSIFEKCNKCGFYHNPEKGCPKNQEEEVCSSKWRVSRNFNTFSCLYNYWFARKYIEKTGTIVLVEGPGDVWRLEEAGIKNSVAIFGSHASDAQISLIESSWAMNIIALFDNDEAGIKACQRIQDKFNRTHRLYFPKIVNAKDVGELNVDQITKDIYPIIEKIGKGDY